MLHSLTLTLTLTQIFSPLSAAIPNPNPNPNLVALECCTHGMVRQAQDEPTMKPAFQTLNVFLERCLHGAVQPTRLGSHQHMLILQSTNTYTQGATLLQQTVSVLPTIPAWTLGRRVIWGSHLIQGVIPRRQAVLHAGVSITSSMQGLQRLNPVRVRVRVGRVGG